MKVLLLVTKSELGGAQKFVFNLATALKKAGVDLVVGGGSGNYLPTALAQENIPFHRFLHLKRSCNPWQVFLFVSELKKYVQTSGFDVVHLNSSNTLSGVWALRQLTPRPKIVFTVHGLSFLDPGHQTNYWSRLFWKLFFRLTWPKVDHLIFVSRLNYYQVPAFGQGKKSQIVCNELPEEIKYFQSREEARKFLSQKAQVDLAVAYLIGSIGRLAYPKNYEFLINAFKDLKKLKPQAKLIIIGEGSERKKYEHLIKSYHLEADVFLLGQINNASGYLKAFDLFVLPSVYEGSSLSLLEARQAGIPVLASRVGGNEEIIGSNNCFQMNNRTEFLEKINKTTNQVGTTVGGNFNEMVASYLKIYQS